jgi:predicted AAA+ superfamily ATPase
MIPRIIKLPLKKSFFLFGSRQTGKSTLIKALFTKDIWEINLLKNDTYLLFLKEPALFRKQSEEKIKSGEIDTIFIDEIQRVPALLSEVHFLMEKFPAVRFILTGSSARKLKRSGVDLLAGRALERHIFPYVYEEIVGTFDLETVLKYGTLPALTDVEDEDKREILEAYVHTYLREEIKAEGLSRNIGGFSKFLDVAASQNGELVNYTAIGRECGISTRTVLSYYEILEDTLVGYTLQPWRKSLRKRLGAHPKFYFFDIGVTNAINRKLTAGIDPVWRGKLFEHFIVLETYRLMEYLHSEASLYFWRTNTGSEVDIIIEKHGNLVAAFEIKSSRHIGPSALSGLRSFNKDNPKVPCYVISMIEDAFDINGVSVLPWRQYIEMLDRWLA